jgi:hypothetical protein
MLGHRYRKSIAEAGGINTGCTWTGIDPLVLNKCDCSVHRLPPTFPQEAVFFYLHGRPPFDCRTVPLWEEIPRVLPDS